VYQVRADALTLFHLFAFIFLYVFQKGGVLLSLE